MIGLQLVTLVFLFNTAAGQTTNAATTATTRTAATPIMTLPTVPLPLPPTTKAPPVAPRSKALNTSCTTTEQCKPAYTQCNVTCQCAPGFHADSTGSYCQPAAYHCPYGSPTASSCLLNYTAPAVNGAPADNCPKGSYCLAFSQNGYIAGSTAPDSGFCCPLPNSVCPVGSPDLTSTCTSQPSTGPRLKACDMSINYCYSETYSGRTEYLCCPTPCGLSDIYNQETNSCYPRRYVNQTCEVSAQCMNSMCNNGICGCGKSQLLVWGFDCVQPVCFYSGPQAVAISNPTTGAVVTCAANNFTCPANSYCENIYGYSVCCSLPTQKCPSTNAKPTTTTLCNPYATNSAATCGAGNSCVFWYTSFGLNSKGQQAYTNEGYCCPNIVVTPSPSPSG